MAFNFFSNNVIYVDGENIEKTVSLSGTRNGLQKVFNVPAHNIDTENLLIFCDGLLKIRDKHYKDINSNEIEFIKPIKNEVDFIAILIKGNKEWEWGYF